ncbi:hypothetical protein WH47_03970 [Habropoda laboriosa]|uniref:Histone-lysine N-methyltransferase SETMAR n=1 Tax=Habropoda laboriosa TaxID=597456 RepID=A0A0L7QU77_9HYME|nr:hypothetical protein WH47_03970 [Habropoda laboriosa]
MNLNAELIDKRSLMASKRSKVILQHDNARPHAAKTTAEKFFLILHLQTIICYAQCNTV